MTQSKLTYADVYEKHIWMYAPQRDDGKVETIRLGHGIECGRGWLPLLDDALTKIGKVVRRMPGNQRERFALVQIKEKYGTLCIYYHGGNADIGEIADEAEALSARTCEECGDYGFSYIFGEEWYCTLCVACAHGRARKRNSSVRLERQQSEDN